MHLPASALPGAPSLLLDPVAQAILGQVFGRRAALWNPGDAFVRESLVNKTFNLANNTLIATSAQLAAALTDETGSGAAVFATSPTLVTPNIGDASASSVDSDSFFTTQASASAPTGVATTVITLANQSPRAWLCSANIGSTSDATNYNAFAVILSDGSQARIALSNNGALHSISLSGLNIQSTQSSGATQTINMTITRIG